ncbi:MAG: 5'-methylthioadenosine/S-adenosylhomocysteine nucleosidase [Cytophagaceae bacterium]|nr:5'-methylthioadenosine/S-adenosylhomocysteine nucleosidase [Cytophagaceae bacterium]
MRYYFDQKAITEAAFVKFQPIEGHMPQIFKGKIATGDAFVSSHEKAAELYQKHHTLATEMEGAAVAQIAYQRGVRFLIIRSCSDNANNNASVDFRTFCKACRRKRHQIGFEDFGGVILVFHKTPITIRQSIGH